LGVEGSAAALIGDAIVFGGLVDLGIGALFALFLQGFELGDVGFALAAETGFLESEIAEIFTEGEEDLGFDHGGADGGVRFVGEFLGELAAADGVDAGFERRDAEQAPFGIGDELHQSLLGIRGRLMVEEETFDVVGVGFDVVGGQQDGAAGEPGFEGVRGAGRVAGCIGGEPEWECYRFFSGLLVNGNFAGRWEGDADNVVSPQWAILRVTQWYCKHSTRPWLVTS